MNKVKNFVIKEKIKENQLSKKFCQRNGEFFSALFEDVRLERSLKLTVSLINEGL